MKVKKLGAFGAEAESIEAPFRQIWDAFFATQILVFGAQQLTAERYLEFARQFGRPEPHVIDQFHHPEHSDILILSNVEKDGKPPGLADAGTYFHTDLFVPRYSGALHDAVLDPGAEEGRRHALRRPVHRL